MKRGLVPLALLATGCGLRPWTPSVSVAFWAEDVPEPKQYSLPTSTDLAQRWTVPASPWSRYGKVTLVSALDPMGVEATLPDVRDLEVCASAEAAAENVARAGVPSNTMWLVDLRGAASAAFAARLSYGAWITPVITFNNWPHEAGLVAADETLAGLLSYQPRLPPPDVNILASAPPVIMLDSWRLAYRFDEPDEDVFDNRYMLMPSDLPDVDLLRERGITNVVYVVEDLDDAEVEEDDLHEVFRAYQAAGIAIYFVDLDTLTTRPTLAYPRYWVRERYTLVDDPHFYARARGGFGLAFGRPFIGHGYRGGVYHGHRGGSAG